MSKLKNTAKANTPKPQVKESKTITPAKTGGGGKAVQKPMPKGPTR